MDLVPFRSRSERIYTKNVPLYVLYMWTHVLPWDLGPPWSWAAHDISLYYKLFFKLAQTVKKLINIGKSLEKATAKNRSYF